MLKVTLFIGLNDKDTKKQEVETSICKQVILYGLLNHDFEGATITLAEGIYTHKENKTIVVENTFKVELLCFEDESDFMKKVYSFATLVKKALNQESIAISKEYIESKLF